MDLTIEKRPASDVLTSVSNQLPAGAYVEPAGGSSAIRIDVPKLDHLGSFDAQIDKARAALRAARTLLGFWPSIRARLGH